MDIVNICCRDTEDEIQQLNSYFYVSNLQLNQMIESWNDSKKLMESTSYIEYEKSKIIFLFEIYKKMLMIFNDKQNVISRGDSSIQINNFLQFKHIIYTSNPSIQVKILSVLKLFILGIVGKDLAVVYY